ncbi:MAG: 30S ribosomal protein S7 [Armatimonadota bacterium]|nr:MAG: 30S ribosomal protein S7 [Armatimonadota bacterium]
MPRKGAISRREVMPDPIFHSRLVTQFINKLLLRGKRSTAERIFYGALQVIAERGKDPLAVLEQALKNTMPVLEVRPRRVGGATYQVPVEVRATRRVDLGMRWLIQNARQRSGKTMEGKLAVELMDAADSQGASVKKREDTHRMAEANKAFAHYRW